MSVGQNLSQISPPKLSALAPSGHKNSEGWMGAWIDGWGDGLRGIFIGGRGDIGPLEFDSLKRSKVRYVARGAIITAAAIDF